ncbi:hypothetical protein ACFS7Z_26375 [Pontibacter toksunensis]|uniref:Uncharacterized protein n=1 Tax=Pontibacter toksunensis TaxID=1332631 RepID=A0ABW6C2I2_9BACT
MKTNKLNRFTAVTYASPCIRLEEEKKKTEKLQAECDHLLSTVNSLEQQVKNLQAEKETLLEDNAAHLARFKRLYKERLQT